MIRDTCPHCGKQSVYKDAAHNKKVKCHKCGTIYRVTSERASSKHETTDDDDVDWESLTALERDADIVPKDKLKKHSENDRHDRISDSDKKRIEILQGRIADIRAWRAKQELIGLPLILIGCISCAYYVFKSHAPLDVALGSILLGIGVGLCVRARGHSFLWGVVAALFGCASLITVAIFLAIFEDLTQKQFKLLTDELEEILPSKSKSNKEAIRVRAIVIQIFAAVVALPTGILFILILMLPGIGPEKVAFVDRFLVSLIFVPFILGGLGLWKYAKPIARRSFNRSTERL